MNVKLNVSKGETQIHGFINVIKSDGKPFVTTDGDQTVMKARFMRVVDGEQRDSIVLVDYNEAMKAGLATGNDVIIVDMAVTKIGTDEYHNKPLLKASDFVVSFRQDRDGWYRNHPRPEQSQQIPLPLK